MTEEISSPPPLEDEIDLGGYVRKFRRYWMLLAAAALVGGAAGLTIAARRPIVYEAVTTLLVHTASPGTPWTAGPLIENSALAAETVKEVGLDRPPDNLTGQGFLRDVLRVEELRSLNLVKVRVTLSDPTRAANASRILSRKALGLNVRLTRDAGSAVRDQLKVHLDESDEQLKAAAQQLLAFQSKAQVDVLKTDTDAMLSERGDLLKLLIDIEAEKSRLAAAEQEIEKQQPTLPVERSVRSEEALRRAGALGAAGTADPESLDLSNPFVNPVYQTLAYQIATSRSNLAALERQRQEMVVVRKLGQGQFSELTDLYGRQIELAKLQGAYDVAKRVNGDLAVKYAQVQAEWVGGMVQLQIIDEAVPPDQPLPRKRLQATAMGLALGLLVGMAAALVLGAGKERTRVP